MVKQRWRSHVRSGLRRLARTAQSHPALYQMAMRLLDRMPALKTRVFRLLFSVAAPVVGSGRSAQGLADAVMPDLTAASTELDHVRYQMLKALRVAQNH